MKITAPFLTLMSLVVCVLTGCQSPKAGPPGGRGAGRAKMNRGYSRLHQILDEQTDVTMVRSNMPQPDAVNDLVRKIAAASGAGSKRLEEFARRGRIVKLRNRHHGAVNSPDAVT